MIQRVEILLGITNSESNDIYIYNLFYYEYMILRISAHYMIDTHKFT